MYSLFKNNFLKKIFNSANNFLSFTAAEIRELPHELLREVLLKKIQFNGFKKLIYELQFLQNFCVFIIYIPSEIITNLRATFVS